MNFWLNIILGGYYALLEPGLEMLMRSCFW